MACTYFIYFSKVMYLMLLLLIFLCFIACESLSTVCTYSASAYYNHCGAPITSPYSTPIAECQPSITRALHARDAMYGAPISCQQRLSVCVFMLNTLTQVKSLDLFYKSWAVSANNFLVSNECASGISHCNLLRSWVYNIFFIEIVYFFACGLFITLFGIEHFLVNFILLLFIQPKAYDEVFEWILVSYDELFKMTTLVFVPKYSRLARYTKLLIIFNCLKWL